MFWNVTLEVNTSDFCWDDTKHNKYRDLGLECQQNIANNEEEEEQQQQQQKQQEQEEKNNHNKIITTTTAAKGAPPCPALPAEALATKCALKNVLNISKVPV